MKEHGIYEESIVSVVLTIVPRYDLKSFVSHIGSTQMAGHYVSVVRRDNGSGWDIFDDGEVYNPAEQCLLVLSAPAGDSRS